MWCHRRGADRRTEIRSAIAATYGSRSCGRIGDRTVRQVAPGNGAGCRAISSVPTSRTTHAGSAASAASKVRARCRPMPRVACPVAKGVASIPMAGPRSTTARVRHRCRRDRLVSLGGDRRRCPSGSEPCFGKRFQCLPPARTRTESQHNVAIESRGPGHRVRSEGAQTSMQEPDADHARGPVDPGRHARSPSSSPLRTVA